ncbi:MAG: hypothetical protein HOE90_02545 [Bacteriovoracaceae bacterium]|nr:hypothetical protein [Bacteriovoracaceae bacterium]
MKTAKLAISLFVWVISLTCGATNYQLTDDQKDSAELNCQGWARENIPYVDGEDFCRTGYGLSAGETLVPSPALTRPTPPEKPKWPTYAEYTNEDVFFKDGPSVPQGMSRATAAAGAVYKRRQQAFQIENREYQRELHAFNDNLKLPRKISDFFALETMPPAFQNLLKCSQLYKGVNSNSVDHEASLRSQCDYRKLNANKTYLDKQFTAISECGKYMKQGNYWNKSRVGNLTMVKGQRGSVEGCFDKQLLGALKQKPQLEACMTKARKSPLDDQRSFPLGYCKSIKNRSHLLSLRYTVCSATLDEAGKWDIENAFKCNFGNIHRELPELLARDQKSECLADGVGCVPECFKGLKGFGLAHEFSKYCPGQVRSIISSEIKTCMRLTPSLDACLAVRQYNQKDNGVSNQIVEGEQGQKESLYARGVDFYHSIMSNE